jgi:hypothetical protein
LTNAFVVAVSSRIESRGAAVDREELERELKKFPPRAIVAFAARCARRVQPLFSALSDRDIEAVDRAIAIAELCASEASTGREEADSAVAAATAADAAANRDANTFYAAGDIADTTNAAYNVFAAASTAANVSADAARAAADAARAAAAADVADVAYAAASSAYAAAGAAAAAAAVYAAAAAANDVWLAISADLQRLAALSPNEPKNRSFVVDPNPFGPLGPLWSEGEPEWFRQFKAKAEAKAAIATDQSLGEAPPLYLYFDLEEFSDNEIAEMIGMLSDVYQEIGGDRLVIDSTTLLQPACAPEGA